MGRFAYSAISSVPNAAARIVAIVLGPGGMPAARRIAGLTTMMYAIAAKVVTPPRISVRAVVRCSFSRNQRSRREGIKRLVDREASVFYWRTGVFYWRTGGGAGVSICSGENGAYGYDEGGLPRGQDQAPVSAVFFGAPPVRCDGSWGRTPWMRHGMRSNTFRPGWGLWTPSA